MSFRKTPIALALAAVMGLSTMRASGQWPEYKTPGIPRLPNGRPNLEAPSPQNRDGKPDLSGLWEVDGFKGYGWNAAQDLTAGDVQPWARGVFRERLLNFGKDHPLARCLPSGLPTLSFFAPFMMRVAQTPGMIVILYRGNGQDVVRTILTDGRKAPDDPIPTWLGYSIGHWDGDTLVVNTSGFNDRGWLDLYGHPQTESLRVTERFRRRDFGHVEFEMTIDDPKVFKKPFSITAERRLVPDTELIETICDNEKDASHLVGGSGFQLSPQELRKYAGTYEVAPGRSVTVTTEDGFATLHDEGSVVYRPTVATIYGRTRLLVPRSETHFVFRDNGDEVEFVRDAQGEVSMLIAHGRGNDQRALRKKAP